MYVPKITAWFRLDDDSRKGLLEGAVREVARRSLAGAMVYFRPIAVPYADVEIGLNSSPSTIQAPTQSPGGFGVVGPSLSPGIC
jgi:hypothetical protein